MTNLDLKKLKRTIAQNKNRLYSAMEGDDFVNPDMLDYALSVIHSQNAYINALESNRGVGKLKARALVSPAIYKHFKDKYYATIGVAKKLKKEGISEADINSKIVFIAEYTEATDNANLEVKILEINGNYYHLRDDLSDLVLYKSLYDNHRAYVRDIDMFLSEVDKEKYPNVEQEYRFELVRY